jgi:hypothetical protein
MDPTSNLSNSNKDSKGAKEPKKKKGPKTLYKGCTIPIEDYKNLKTLYDIFTKCIILFN